MKHNNNKIIYAFILASLFFNTYRLAANENPIKFKTLKEYHTLEDINNTSYIFQKPFLQVILNYYKFGSPNRLLCYNNIRTDKKILIYTDEMKELGIESGINESIADDNTLWCNKQNKNEYCKFDLESKKILYSFNNDLSQLMFDDEYAFGHNASKDSVFILNAKENRLLYKNKKVPLRPNGLGSSYMYYFKEYETVFYYQDYSAIMLNSKTGEVKQNIELPNGYNVRKYFPNYDKLLVFKEEDEVYAYYLYDIKTQSFQHLYDENPWLPSPLNSTVSPSNNTLMLQKNGTIVFVDVKTGKIIAKNNYSSKTGDSFFGIILDDNQYGMMENNMPVYQIHSISDNSFIRSCGFLVTPSIYDTECFILSKFDTRYMLKGVPSVTQFLDLTKNEILGTGTYGFTGNDHCGFDFLQDGRILVGSNRELGIYSYSVSHKQAVYEKIYELSNDSIAGVAVSPDGKYYALSGFHGKVYIIETANNKLLKTINILGIPPSIYKNESLFNLRFTKDGKYLYGGGPRWHNRTTYMHKFSDLGTVIIQTSDWTPKIMCRNTYSSSNRWLSKNGESVLVNNYDNQFFIQNGVISRYPNMDTVMLDKSGAFTHSFSGFSLDDKYVFSLKEGKIVVYNATTGERTYTHSSSVGYTWLTISDIDRYLILFSSDSKIITMEYSDESGVFEINHSNSYLVNSDGTNKIILNKPINPEMELHLFNIQGQEIDTGYTISVNNDEIIFEANGINPGVYTLMAKEKSKSFSIKILVK